MNQPTRPTRHRVFLDANVLFTAAHNPKGKAAFLFEKQAAGLWHLCTSAFALEEARRNLQRKYPECIARLVALDSQLSLTPQPAVTFSLPLELPEKDQPILAAALAAQCSHLLTGDIKHFGADMNRPADTQGLTIQTVAQYLDAL